MKILFRCIVYISNANEYRGNIIPQSVIELLALYQMVFERGGGVLSKYTGVTTEISKWRFDYLHITWRSYDIMPLVCNTNVKYSIICSQS